MQPFDQMPTVQVPRPRIPGDAGAEGALSPEDLARYNRRGRLQALALIAGSAALLTINHLSAARSHEVWLKAIYGGAIFLMIGLFGMFQPLVMSRHLPPGKRLPRSVLVGLMASIAAGGLLGWEIQTFYLG